MYLSNVFATAVQNETKNFKSYILILAIVNYRKGFDASLPLRTDETKVDLHKYCGLVKAI